MRYIISTLGCKVNQFETQAMEARLQEHGHLPAAPGEMADAVIVNTCAVTAESGRKSRQTIRRLRDENPGAVVAVCGCYAQLSPEDAEEIGAGVLFGAADRMDFVAAVEKAVAEGERTRRIDEPFLRRSLEKLPAGAMDGRTRAMLKIQDGCVNFCTYCIIPYTRGRLRSLPLADAAAETARIRQEGYRELVLTGIEVASYGVDLPRPCRRDRGGGGRGGGHAHPPGFPGAHGDHRGFLPPHRGHRQALPALPPVPPVRLRPDPESHEPQI